MSNKDDIRIKEFLNKTSAILTKLEGIGLKEFDKRVENLSHNISSYSKHTVRSGLVGITSSGKSSLLNVLLGTGSKLLKEQSKATTNMIVLCSKSETPELEIHFEGKKPFKKSGDSVLSESIWKYTSEDENPGNRHNVKYIKLALPTFILDKDLEIADTPGLDAHGHKEHEDLTLREFLPQADMIIYLSSIRSPMKDADRRILNKIMDADQRIIFVQTCKGAVVEGNYGESSTESVKELLEKYKKEFAKSIRPYAKLKDSPIVQVETTQALKYFKNKDKAAWEDSGLDEFVHVSQHVTRQLQDEYTQKNLRRIVDEINALNKLIRNTVQEEGDKEGSIEERSDQLKRLKDRLEKIEGEKKAIIAEWNKKLDAKAIHKKCRMALSKIYGNRYDYNPIHDKEFITKAQSISKEIQKIKNDFLAVLDGSKERYREYFSAIGLDVRRTDIQNTAKGSFFLPNVQKKSVSDAVGSGSSSSRFSFWKEKSEDTKEYIDKAKFIDELGPSLSYFFEPLLNHLEWWDKMINHSFVEPLRKKIAAFEDDMVNIKKGASYDDTQYKGLNEISIEMEDVLDGIAYLCDANITRRKLAGYVRSTKGGYADNGLSDYKNIFVQLGNRLFEGLFHDYYIKCLSGMSGGSRKTIALTGDDKEAMINFLRRLLRLDGNAFMTLLDREMPFALNMRTKIAGMNNLEIQGELDDTFSFFVLGNDKKSYEAAKKAKLFDKADVIQLMVNDLHRVGSAANDITERNVHYDLISRNREKLLLTYPGAAHFQKERLHIMVHEAISEINRLFGSEQVRWFIYENFEIRYSYFNDLASKVMGLKSGPEDFIKEWKREGIPLDAPFDEMTLAEQYEDLMNVLGT